MAKTRLDNWFRNQIEQHKASHIHFSGRHNVVDANSSSIREMIDFDFSAQVSGFVDFSMIEITASTNANTVVMMVAGGTEEASEEGLLQQAVEKLNSISLSEYEGVTIIHEIVNREVMAARLQTWANHARYGGRVQFEHKSVSATLVPEMPTSNKSCTNIRVVWKYKWTKPSTTKSPAQRRLPSRPNICPGPRLKTWEMRVPHAMVDGERGVIALGDDVVGGSPMIKAMAKHALYEPLAAQGQFRTSKIHRWGMDEPNGEPSYLGYRSFGAGARADLPPPYSA
ncbi:hypothetical protein E4T38_04719 [Aureobasidium subglaciale]|nr:hypothetical protein E4T38_04719 [Aureobasidium subglaciale]KAI5223110.1 hypothetical protein E4T40_04684 [Aureobasidium subglaciale]KAI5226798.1 hypothetical protein E4T41_04627 [Aureobasidium subglaciale]KAI5262440.1 hypothetical protein E4T46_04513 [Aureobasidium subglaciale]